MTCIINPVLYPTKKALKEALLEKHTKVDIEDPSVFEPKFFSTETMALGERVIVTNHPKRSYFATIEKRIDGTFKVL